MYFQLIVVGVLHQINGMTVTFIQYVRSIHATYTVRCTLRIDEIQPLISYIA